MFIVKKSPKLLRESMMGAQKGNLGVSSTSLRPELHVDDELFPKNVENDAFRTDFDRARCSRVVN